MRTCSFSNPSPLRSGSGRTMTAPDAEIGTGLCAMVSAAFRLAPDDIKSASRGAADVAFARQVIMYLAHTRLRYPYVVAGRLVGRDRTTARHACRKIEDMREDPRLDAIIDHLERAIDILPGFSAGRSGQ